MEVETETETETERQRDRETDRQTDRQKDRQTDRQREIKIAREREGSHQLGDSVDGRTRGLSHNKLGAQVLSQPYPAIS